MLCPKNIWTTPRNRMHTHKQNYGLKKFFHSSKMQSCECVKTNSFKTKSALMVINFPSFTTPVWKIWKLLNFVFLFLNFFFIVVVMNHLQSPLNLNISISVRIKRFNQFTVFDTLWPMSIFSLHCFQSIRTGDFFFYMLCMMQLLNFIIEFLNRSCHKQTAN